MPLRHILAATDLSTAGDHAVAAAHQLCVRSGAKLSVVHVVPDSPPVAPLMPESATPQQQAQRDVLEAARRAVGARVEGITGRPHAETDIHVLEGPAVAGIFTAQHRTHADWMVVGGHLPVGLLGRLLGGVADSVLRTSPVPVLVARGMFTAGEVVVATDLSVGSQEALRAAAEVASLWKMPLRVLHSVEQLALVPPAMGALAGTVTTPPPNVVEELRAAAREIIGTQLQLHGAENASVEVVDGDPGSALVHAGARPGVALLVLATHGRTGLARVALGSVAEHVVRHARCNVLVVRRSDAAAH